MVRFRVKIRWDNYAFTVHLMLTPVAWNLTHSLSFMLYRTAIKCLTSKLIFCWYNPSYGTLQNALLMYLFSKLITFQHYCQLFGTYSSAGNDRALTSGQESRNSYCKIQSTWQLSAMGTRGAVRPRDKTFLAGDEREVEITVDRNGIVAWNCTAQQLLF